MNYCSASDCAALSKRLDYLFSRGHFQTTFPWSKGSVQLLPHQTVQKLKGSLHYQQHWHMLTKLTASPSAIQAPLKLLKIQCATLHKWNTAVHLMLISVATMLSWFLQTTQAFEVASVWKIIPKSSLPKFHHIYHNIKPGEFIPPNNKGLQ